METVFVGFSPIDQVNSFASSCSFTLHTSYKKLNGMLDQNAQKQII